MSTRLDVTVSLAVLLVVHGLIRLLGAAKAFGWADLPQLTQPIDDVEHNVQPR